MPKRPHKLPKGVGYYTPLAPISEAGWRRIERAYGKKLADGVREAIFGAMKFYVLAESTERSAEPIKDAKKRIKILQRAAATLQNEIASGATSYAGGVLITKHFQDPRLSDRSGGLYVGRVNSLIYVLGSFVAACERAIGDLAPPASTVGILGDLSALPSWKAGEEWKKWIRQLIKIMEANEQRARARKDVGNKSKSDEESAFVRLVCELQNFLPAGCGRHTHSKGALAQGYLSGQIKFAALSE